MHWVDIRGFTAYQISNTGLVRSRRRTVTQISRWGREMVRVYDACNMKPRLNKQGYLYLTLSKDGKSKTYKIHRLVAQHFVDGYEEGLCVNHIDGNKINNAADNLEWITLGDNIRHAIALKLKPDIQFGENSPACIGYIEAINEYGEVTHTFAGERECRSLGFTPAGVSATMSGIQKTHRNKTFRIKGK